MDGFTELEGGNWIFVSHSNTDIVEVRGIRDFFESRGHNPILFYLRSLNDDDHLPELLEREINARNFFVLCDSPNSRRSKWVQEEIRMVKLRPEKVYEEVDLTRDLESQLHKLEALAKRATVFLSYSSRDRQIGTRISTSLRDADFRLLEFEPSLFEPQMPRLIKEAMNHGFVLLLVTKQWTTSQFASVEYTQALEEALALEEQTVPQINNLVPVLIEDVGVVPVAFWRLLTPIDFRGEDFEWQTRKLILELKTRRMD